MTPDDEAKADEYDRAVVRLKSERGSLQKEILEELSTLKQNPDAGQIRNEIDESIKILKRNDLTGDEADQVSDTLANLSILDIGNIEEIDRFIQQWDVLYPIEIEMKIDNRFAIEQMRELM